MLFTPVMVGDQESKKLVMIFLILFVLLGIEFGFIIVGSIALSLLGGVILSVEIPILFKKILDKLFQ